MEDCTIGPSPSLLLLLLLLRLLRLLLLLARFRFLPDDLELFRCLRSFLSLSFRFFFSFLSRLASLDATFFASSSSMARAHSLGGAEGGRRLYMYIPISARRCCETHAHAIDESFHLQRRRRFSALLGRSFNA